MAKTLATYRDEAKATFDDDTILGAFPVWLEEAHEIAPVRPSKTGLLLGAGMTLFGPVVAFVGTIGSGLFEFVRSSRRTGSTHEDTELRADATSATMLVRTDRIDIHEVDPLTLRVGGRVVTHHKDQRVQIGRNRLGNAAVIDLLGSRWMARRTHERALRGLLTAQGYRIEPLA